MKIYNFINKAFLFWENFMLAVKYILSLVIVLLSTTFIINSLYFITGVLLDWKDVISFLEKTPNAGRFIGLTISVTFLIAIPSLILAYKYLKNRQRIKESFYLVETKRAQEKNYYPLYDDLNRLIKHNLVKFNLANFPDPFQKDNILKQVAILISNQIKPSQ